MFFYIHDLPMTPCWGLHLWDAMSQTSRGLLRTLGSLSSQHFSICAFAVVAQQQCLYTINLKQGKTKSNRLKAVFECVVFSVWPGQGQIKQLCNVFLIYSKRLMGLTLSLELDEYEFRSIPAGVSFSALSLVIAAVPLTSNYSGNAVMLQGTYKSHKSII